MRGGSRKATSRRAENDNKSGHPPRLAQGKLVGAANSERWTCGGTVVFEAASAAIGTDEACSTEAPGTMPSARSTCGKSYATATAHRRPALGPVMVVPHDDGPPHEVLEDGDHHTVRDGEQPEAGGQRPR
eukprot:CAMPEP_0177488576 /NCGR_PEP_ID=MMETSP0369-20130122/30232_1 /TAXON_ID=447022 ORGANISM="Scrippsiella hangoei-like, Strain SHHI-4" /NCGR_SAMPLE_ID=MMETSP0369 /ASSEMBLY_ACC=CAM_ASM_000364 /LENGTH=129 /DNA_ID=CAMNT_0018964959 /DNA_START=327 /DNA_END=714 /DNA_ORIENTATION=-